MKRLLLLFLTATSTLLAQPTVPGSSDEWPGRCAGISHQRNLRLHAGQGRDFQLHAKDAEGKAYDTTVTVNDKKVVFVHGGEYEGQALTITFSGTYNDKGELAGAIDVQPLNYDGTPQRRQKRNSLTSNETSGVHRR